MKVLKILKGVLGHVCEVYIVFCMFFPIYLKISFIKTPRIENNVLGLSLNPCHRNMMRTLAHSD